VSNGLVTVQRAKRAYRCAEFRRHDGDGLDRIEPGDYYARAAIPPGHDTINNSGWLTDRLCLHCAGLFGYDVTCKAATSSAEWGELSCYREKGHGGMCMAVRTAKRHPTGKPYFWYGANLPDAIAS
jgi:hypothetical protein